MPRPWIAVAAAAALLASCSSGPDDSPERVMEVREVYSFEDLPTMVATSDLVVIAQVEAVRPGAYVGPEGGRDRDRVRAVDLVVQKVLHGSAVRPGSRVQLDEWGWDSEGRGFQLANVSWSRPGMRAVYFLLDGDAGRYRLVSTQGRLLLAGDGSLESSAARDHPFRAVVEEMTVTDVEAVVSRAEKGIASGAVTRQLTPQEVEASS